MIEVLCNILHCSKHQDEISVVYSQTLHDGFDAANLCIPKIRKNYTPGWNEYAEDLKCVSSYHHGQWELAGCPVSGDVADKRRETRLPSQHSNVLLMFKQH